MLLDWWHRSPPCMRRAVIVSLRDDSAGALRGVLWTYRDNWLVLREVQLLRGGQPPTPVDGEVVLHRDNVLFVQVP